MNPNSLDHIPSIKYGVINEEKAIKRYEEWTGQDCESSGLVVHQKHQFLAGSPDALTELDGIVEVKCPFSIKHE